MAMDMEISITGSEPGKVNETLYCYVMNLDEPLHLHVEADFKVKISVTHWYSAKDCLRAACRFLS